MATHPLPEAAARSPESVEEPVAPPPSAIAAALAQSKWIPLPPELAQPLALPSEPTLLLRPAAQPLPDPDASADAEPSQPPTLLYYLFLATCGVVALVAVLVFTAYSRTSAHRAGSLLTTGTTYSAKPSADGEPLEPQPAPNSHSWAPVQADSEPDPPDTAASPDIAAQPVPTGDDPASAAPAETPVPAEPPQTNPSPVDAQPAPAPPADSPTL